jgi:hypothetical protein
VRRCVRGHVQCQRGVVVRQAARPGPVVHRATHDRDVGIVYCQRDTHVPAVRAAHVLQAQSGPGGHWDLPDRPCSPGGGVDHPVVALHECRLKFDHRDDQRELPRAPLSEVTTTVPTTSSAVASCASTPTTIKSAGIPAQPATPNSPASTHAVACPIARSLTGTASPTPPVSLRRDILLREMSRRTENVPTVHSSSRSTRRTERVGREGPPTHSTARGVSCIRRAVLLGEDSRKGWIGRWPTD